MGNVRLTVFPIREMVFREVPPDEPKMATYKAKWDEEYRKRWGLENHFAEDLDSVLVTNIQEKCKEIYRLLTIDGYARVDLRLTSENKLYFIEANPNPILADDEDFALAAERPACRIRNSSIGSLGKVLKQFATEKENLDHSTPTIPARWDQKIIVTSHIEFT
jgi:D-ala D-ala ligase C-terminus